MFRPSVSRTSISKFSRGEIIVKQDLLVVEEPLEIRLIFGTPPQREERTLTITMRTPGHDFELAVGFLLNEGIIQDFSEVESIRYCDSTKSPNNVGNIVKVNLLPYIEVDWEILKRNFYTTSSCGICGKASIDAVRTKACKSINQNYPPISTDIITQLSQKLLDSQTIFTHTGGIHAAGLFNMNGELFLSREDIGRHNAVDKVIGAASIQKISLGTSILFLSGRVGFELVQKARVAAIPIVVAVGAPSSLAVELAIENGMTLLGFLRNQRFNIYSGYEKVKVSTIENIF